MRNKAKQSHKTQYRVANWPEYNRSLISQAAFALGARRNRYRGRAKTHLRHLTTAAAINLLRALACLKDVSRSVSRQSHFAALAA